MDWTTRTTTVVLCIAFILTSIHNVSAEKRVVCYYTNWSVYRPGTAKFSPQNINPYLCTHLIYAFGGFTKDNTLKPFDKYQDIEKGGYAKFNGLKTYNKKLKTMLAIGGWNEGSTRFSPLVADPERREELVKNSVKFLRQNHFDGLDLDWEYPAFRDGGKPRDRDNYADFVQELREEFERESSKTGRPRLLLSMAIPAGIEYLEKGYDLPRLNEYLDFFNLLSYDYHSAFEPAVNHHSPLYGLEEDNEYNYDSELTIDYTISYLLKHEVTSEKLVLGIPTYGRSYTLFNEEAREIGAPADGPGEEGDATREKGYLAYYEICENIGKSDEWEVVQPNPKSMGPYAVRGNQWVGYDDEEIVRVKAHYVNEKGLGGIMFWSIDNDDFRGKCHDRPYPLIEAAKEAMLTANNRKSRPNQRTKSSSNRTKTRPVSNNQRSEDDSTNHRLRFETNKRKSSSTTQSTRRKISSTRANSRPSEKNRLNIVDNDEGGVENIETVDNSVKERTSKNRNKSRPRTRANVITSKRKVQSRKGDDQLEDEIQREEESLSNKWTTPEPPTTPDPGSDFKCQDEGFFPHPRDCKKYFWCLDSGPSGLGIVANQFTCPSGLVFNKIADSCDYPRNVICPKTKSPSIVSTTKAPITTTRTTFQQKTTRKTSTTKPQHSAEEYEYDDDDFNIAEDEEDEEEEEITDRNTFRSTTIKPLIYKTITRSKPTTTSTTTTTTAEAPTTAAWRSHEPNTHNVLDLKEEEDPKVLKELIDLIKKAGGLEQLEKQLKLQENHSPHKENVTKENSRVTPATISRTLYERVLNRQAPRIGGHFGVSSTRAAVAQNDVTEKITLNSKVNYQNGPGGAQFEGLDDIPEVKSLRRTNKPQYITIERPKPSTQASFSDEDVDDDLPQRDEFQKDNSNVASSDEHAISNPPNNNDDNDDDDDDMDEDDEDNDKDESKRKGIPSYVNIRRTRPSTPASENDLVDKDEAPPTESASPEFNGEEQSLEANERHSSTIKSRYTSIQRSRSTTAQSVKPISSIRDALNSTDDTSMSLIDPTTPKNIQIEKASSGTSLSPTLKLSTFESPSEMPALSANGSSIIKEFTTTARSALGSSQTPTSVDPVVALIENFVTEIPQTTSSTITSPKTIQPLSSKTTTTVAQPRTFGFSRRGRPTTTTTSPTTTTEQNRVKVKSKHSKELPTLKELINNNIETNRNIAKPLESSKIKHSQGIQIPLRILGDLEDEEMIGNQFALLQLPESTLNFTVWHNIEKMQLIEELNHTHDVRTEIDFKSVTKVDDTPVTMSSTENVIRGFYVTKGSDESQSKAVTSTDVGETTTDISENISGDSSMIDIYPGISTYLSTVDFTSGHNYADRMANENLENTSTFPPITIINELENDLQSISEIEEHEKESEEFLDTKSTSSSVTTMFTTESPTSPPQSKERRPVKQITVHRRPTALDETQSKRQHVVATSHNKVVENVQSPRPENWRKKIIRKRPIPELTNDQNIAETQPQPTVTLLMPPTILFDVSNKSRNGDTDATVEINLFRSPGILLRKPGSITRPDIHDRFRPSLGNPIDIPDNMRVSQAEFSSKISADAYDQSGRAQELLAVSIADPPNATPTIETGNETTIKIRGIQKHKIETRYNVHTEPPTIVRTTIKPVRRRQGPKNEIKINVDVTSPRSRRPAIIDYDYYVDEEVRLSIKPELKNKIYITKSGAIRCLDQGNFAHPTSCKKFITCAPMVSGQVIATEYTCPAKLSFDPVGGICNWSAGLGCNP